MYVYMVITYYHSRVVVVVSMDQPGKVANPARGHLNTEYIFFLSPLFGPQNSVSRDRFGRPVPRQPAFSPNSG